jgi:hypothetical protein
MTLREFTKEAVTQTWGLKKVLNAIVKIKRTAAKAKAKGLSAAGATFRYTDPKLKQVQKVLRRLEERAAGTR